MATLVGSPPVPIDQCDVTDKEALRQYREKLAKWHRWLWTDDHHAIWPQIYSMLISDMTYRSISAAAEIDKESALYCPIIMRGLVNGYASGQGLAIRRLADETPRTISLFQLLGDIRKSLPLLTRENFVCVDGLPFDSSQAAHAAFDRISGTHLGHRERSDRIPKRIVTTLDRWLAAPEIDEVVKWSHKFVAHAADHVNQALNAAVSAPTMEKIATAQRRIVRVAETISAYLLRGSIHGAIIPVFQYSQFRLFDMVVRNPDAVTAAQDCWRKLTEERDGWTDGIIEELVDGRRTTAA